MVNPFKTQLMKWIGNKQRFAHQIASFFPTDIKTYREPFLGSAAVLATFQPHRAVASDVFKPLMDIWLTLSNNPEQLKQWYKYSYELVDRLGKQEAYLKIRESYNKSPNGRDLLFLSRSCYGGVVRFRVRDGGMSTPCGVHNPISCESFNQRVDLWFERTKGTTFKHMDYKEAFEEAAPGDLIYCDPPYVDSQKILYGGQSFDILSLYNEIDKAKRKGVRVALSIDGIKKSGKKTCNIQLPDGLFETQVYIDLGSSMLKRFQKSGDEMIGEDVKDRLLLTYSI